jgi:hypothetical protein
MSVKDQYTESIVPGRAGERTYTQASVPPQKRWLARMHSPLWLCLLFALLVRVWLVIHTNGFIDGDEALVGIQAQHILHGELPIYFYNQPYMGSLEAYLVALLFAIFGSSVWTLRAEPILLSLVVVYLTWRLAALLADYTHVSQPAKRWFMTIAALFAAIPPLYDTVLELRTLGGYIEIFLLMLLLLIAVLQLTRRQQAGTTLRELAWYWAAIGLIVGLGFWINPLIVCALLAAALWLLWSFVQLARQYTQAGQTAFSVLKQLIPATAALPTCLLGLTPALIWGATHQWYNFTYLIQLGGNTPLRAEIVAQYPTRQAILFGLVHLYATCDGPRVVGGALPGEAPVLSFLQTPTLLLGVFCTLATALLIALSFVRQHPLLLSARRLAGLPLLFGACSAFIFCATSTAAIGLWHCKYDLAGRYAIPLMLALPFFFATIFAVILIREEQADEKSQQQPPILARQLIIDPTRIAMSTQSSSSVPGAIMMRVAFGLLLGFVLVSLYLQAGSYGLADPSSTFQSPYCVDAPANNDAIIAYMQREHIHYVWANNWIAYPLDFKSNGSIIASDPLPTIRNIPTLDRIPAYTDAIRHADRPSMAVLVNHDDSSPALLKLLDSEHVTYKLARFPSVPGIDLLVVTPLTRTVSPFEPNKYFNIFFCSRNA